MTAEILALCRVYFASNYDHLKRVCEVAGSEGRELIADVGRVVDFRKEVTAERLDTVMDVMVRINELDDNTRPLAVHGEEIHPRDMDYPHAKAVHSITLNSELTTAVHALIPKQ